MVTMTRRSTDRKGRWRRLIEHFGPRRTRQALVAATLLCVLLLIGLAALLLRQGEHWQRWVRIGLIGMLALLALWLWMRVLRIQWARLRVESADPGPANEDTGIWGVGGPGMRTPGNTGLTRVLPRRRAQDDDEGGENPP
jgi:hypothetical protein